MKTRFNPSETRRAPPSLCGGSVDSRAILPNTQNSSCCYPLRFLRASFLDPQSGHDLLNDLVRINQRREVETNDVYLQFDSIVVLNHGANDGILDLAAKQIHADFVTGLEVALWFLGWHAVDCMTGKAATVRGGAVSAARTGLVRVNASLGAVLSGGFTNLSIALFFAVSVWKTWESQHCQNRKTMNRDRAPLNIDRAAIRARPLFLA